MSPWGSTTSGHWKAHSSASLCSDPSPTPDTVRRATAMTSCYCRFRPSGSSAGWLIPSLGASSVLGSGRGEAGQTPRAVNRVQHNRFMRPVPLPQTQNRLRPGTRCTVAGWSLPDLNTRTDTLQCVQLRAQRDSLCSRRFMSYNGRTHIFVGTRDRGSLPFW